MGRIICAGLGPGDPDLMSVRADRLVRTAQHVAFFRKKGRSGQARKMVNALLAPGAMEYAMEYPVTTELPFDSPAYIECLARFYDEWAARLTELARTRDIVVLCEGDPFFTGPSCTSIPGCKAAQRWRWCRASPAWWAAGGSPVNP